MLFCYVCVCVLVFVVDVIIAVVLLIFLAMLNVAAAAAAAAGGGGGGGGITSFMVAQMVVTRTYREQLSVVFLLVPGSRPTGSHAML